MLEADEAARLVDGGGDGVLAVDGENHQRRDTGAERTGDDSSREFGGADTARHDQAGKECIHFDAGEHWLIPRSDLMEGNIPEATVFCQIKKSCR